LKTYGGVAGRAEDSCCGGPQQEQEGNIVSLIVSGKNTVFVVLFYTRKWHRFFKLGVSLLSFHYRGKLLLVRSVFKDVFSEAQKEWYR
jgi:hypothetical protein